MRVVHVVAGLPCGGSGLAEVVPRLALETVRAGNVATIATVTSANQQLSDAAFEAEAGGVAIKRFSPSFPRIAYASQEMILGNHSLDRIITSADVVHVHSLWTFPVWWACSSAARCGKPYVMSPHGCLDPLRLAHSAWKKRLVGCLDRACLRNAAALHATSDSESGWIRTFLDATGRCPRIDVIPNGVTLPHFSPLLCSPAKSEDRMRRVLYLGRLHPLKGLDMLLHAWARLKTARRWELVVAGPDERGTRARLEALSRSLGLATVSFAGPLSGDEKARAITTADLVVLPSRSENFGLVVAEALAAGIPVITTTATPWAEIHGRCGWWVDPTVDTLASALADATQSTDAERTAMGADGRELIEAKYRWPAVAAAMLSLYRELITFPPPDLV